MPTEPRPTNPWLESARQSLASYRTGTDRMFDLAPSWEGFASDRAGREMARLLHDAARARAGVVREWFIAPLWLAGIASPSDLGNEVQNMIKADRHLAEAWFERFSGQSRQLAENALEVFDVAKDALDRTEDLNEKVASAVKSSAKATAEAAVEANDTYAHVVRESFEQAASVASVAAELSDKAAAGFVDATRAATKKALDAGKLVKGNATRDGEKIFHVPGQASYEQLQTETLFLTQSEAIAAGYRIARSAGGPAIKGNIGRDGTRIYHVRGQVNYDRVEPEALFMTEAEAAAEGFRPAQR